MIEVADDGAGRSAEDLGPDGADGEPLPAVAASWGSAPGITQSEILDWLQRGGYIRSIIVESEPSDTHKTRYSVVLLTSWRTGYHIMHVNWPARPRPGNRLNGVGSYRRG